MIKIIKNMVSEEKTAIKCPYAMEPKWIVVHNTYNDASAENEIAYMIRNFNEVSFHFAVDDLEVVQGIPLNRNAWHSSDGSNGEGNRYGIAVEICYSKSGGPKFDKAEENASLLIAQLLNERKWGIDRVKRHYDFAPDKKYCPHRTMDKGWDRFLNMIQRELDKLNKTETSSKLDSNPSTTSSKNPNRSTGALFTCTGLWTQASGGTWYPSSKLLYGKGDYTIGKVHFGTEHPYEALRNGEIIGFANDKCIDDEPSLPGGKNTSPTSTMTARQFALEVWNEGKHGTGSTRTDNAKRLGVDPSEAQRLINILASGGNI